MPGNYVELHSRSAFSFLEGASLPEELVSVCAELGGSAMALLDRDGVYGAPRFHLAAKKLGIKAHIGAEITLALDNGHASQITTLPLLVESRAGYQNLCRLITLMKLRAPKHAKPGEVAATTGELAEHAEGLICLTGGDDGPFAFALRGGGLDEATAATKELVEIFGRGNVYAELQRHFNRSEEARNQAAVDVARRLKLPLLATNGVCYAGAGRRQLADVLTCIRNHVRLDAAGRLLARNSERHLKSASEMSKLFADLPDAIAHTRQLSSRLDFTLKDLGYEFPKYPVPDGETMDSFLRKRTYEGARRRYTGANGMPTYQRALHQIDRELALIEKLHLAGYFLIVWDIVNFCRAGNILVQGRGSAANSAVCYSLGITAVDPVGMELLFERFLSEERGEWPDIDLDLPSGDQRERVIQYVYQRYGRHGAAMTANVITYRGRSAAREVGKVMGFDEKTIDMLSSLVRAFEWQDPNDTPERQFRDAGLDLRDLHIKKFFELYLAAQDLPRHLGQHSGGMVICQGQLDSVVPLEPATMPGRVVVQWDKEDCADMGIIKVDLLGLGMLAAIEECLTLIRDHYHEEVDLAHLPQDDPAVYDALQKADTIGLFQVESRAQMSCLPRLRPQKFYDIVVQVAIIRPGPIVGNMVHPYLNRRLGREEATCLHPSLEPVLRRTLGVPLFQEQLLRIAMICANFTGGEAEELRRAMGFKRSEARMREIEVKLRRGMEQNGITGETQDKIVQAITSFALYGFPESHAASFALIAYASAYLRCHYLAAFTAALLNNQPMGFYQPATIIKDAQRHGLKINPIDVTRSGWNCTIEVTGYRGQGTGERERGARDKGQRTRYKQGPVPCNLSPVTYPAMRLGLRYVKGLREESARAIVRERIKRPFADIDDLHNRVPELRKDELRKLAQVGALNFIGTPNSEVKGRERETRSAAINSQSMHRRSALWQVERVARPVGPLLREKVTGYRGEVTGDRGQGTGERLQGTGDRLQGTGDRVQGTEDREQGTGDRVQGTGDRGQGTGNREQGTGYRGQGTGDREQGTGNRGQVTGNRVQGTGYRGWTGNRGQATGDREQGTAEKGQSPVTCNLSPVTSFPVTSPPSPLKPMTIEERVNADFQGTGVTLGRHPMAYRREELNKLEVKRAIDLRKIRNGVWVKIAGWVIVRQRPGTAKGFMFLSMEDETGIANIIVTPDIFDGNRRVLVNEPLLMIEGPLQNQDGVIHVRARRIQALSYAMAAAASHDFH